MLHMSAKIRTMAATVMALKPTDRTLTQTDIAPSLMRAAAMAPAVIEVRKGMSMGLLSGCGGKVMDKEKRPGIAPRALRGRRNMGRVRSGYPFKSNRQWVTTVIP